MTEQEWKGLYSDIFIPESSLPTLPKPTDKYLDEYEEESGLALPASYRSFIKTFGPGVLAWSYRILAPGYAHQGDSVDLALFNKDAKSRFDKSFLKGMKDPEQVLRVVYCVRQSGGDLIGWDPCDISDSVQPEYGIYLLGRESFMEKIANSFTSFIMDVCLGKGNLNLPKDIEEEQGTRYIFEPESDIPNRNKYRGD